MKIYLVVLRVILVLSSVTFLSMGLLFFIQHWVNTWNLLSVGISLATIVVVDWFYTKNISNVKNKSV